MKRDLELIRRLLLYIEEHEALPSPEEMQVDQRTRDFHLLLLYEAKLTFGLPAAQCDDGSIQVFTTTTPRLTWEGCEFLDAARDQSVWEDALERTKKVGGAVGIGVMVELLKDATLRKLGLRP